MGLIGEKIKQFKQRLSDEITLVAVSKTKPVEDIREAYEAGQRDFGENKIQDMLDKYEELPKDIRWHMVGHVQGNKIKYMAPFVYLVHGIDKPKRLKELNKEAAKNDRVINCLLQVHIAKEETKFGFSFDEALEVMKNAPVEKYPHVHIRGLMGMATFTDDQQQVRNEFRGLKSFFNKIIIDHNPPEFNILSMGMSSDYQLAIDEGSNMIRIGTEIFGKRDYQ